jgi:hypothetical protein
MQEWHWGEHALTIFQLFAFLIIEKEFYRIQKCSLCDGDPSQGLSEARGPEMFFFVTDPPRGRPVLGRRNSSYLKLKEYFIIDPDTTVFTGIPFSSEDK